MEKSVEFPKVIGLWHIEEDLHCGDHHERSEAQQFVCERSDECTRTHFADFVLPLFAHVPHNEREQEPSNKGESEQNDGIEVIVHEVGIDINRTEPNIIFLLINNFFLLLQD